MRPLIIYDCEIANPIATKAEAKDPAFTYAGGWTDYAGMGISVIAAYQWNAGYRIFMSDNMAEFVDLVCDPQALVVGYGNDGFDDPLIGTVLGVDVTGRSWDLMAAVTNHEHKRQSLHNLCVANFMPGKTINGHEVPLLWQRGEIGKVIDYCLSDVIRTKKMLEAALEGNLRSPSSGRRMELDLQELREFLT